MYLSEPRENNWNITKGRSSNRWCFIEKVVTLKNFAIFTGRHLCWGEGLQLY